MDMEKEWNIESGTELIYSSPEKERMNAHKLESAFHLLDRETERGEIPGGVAFVGRHGKIVGTHTAGRSIATDFASYSVQKNTIYDCASLTKVVVTLPLILQLIDRGEVRLGDPVCRYLPSFASNGKSDVTLKQLLTHTSGFSSYKNLHSNGWTTEEIKASVWDEELTFKPGTSYVYSDLNFITLGEIASLLFNVPLDTAARTYIFEPLGMRESTFCPSEALKPRIAATEFMNDNWRWGEVHDENAWALGGISGHAGLFSTASDLSKYAAMWLNKGRYQGGILLSSSAVAAATRSYTAHLNTNRGLGWVLKGDPWDSSGDWSSPLSYGHTGFTGTSLWMDAETGIFAVLLTNRIHFGRDKSVAWLRDCFHNAVAASIED
jgi:CubicO group peptidase (beta-lactamase class C family)